MRKSIVILSLIQFAFLISNPSFSQGYHIDINIKGLRDTSVYLAYHFGDKKLVHDTIYLDNQGAGVYKGDRKLDAGIYLLALPNMNFFEFIVDKDQSFSISTDTANLIESLKFSGSSQNSTFLEYQKFMGIQQNKSKLLASRREKNKDNPDSLKVIMNEMKKLDQRVKEYWNKIITVNEGLLISGLVNLMKPPEPPEFTIPDNAANKDSLRWIMGYNYNRDHFLDNVDFSDQRLLRTPVFKPIINRYFNNILIQKPDSIIPQITKVVNRCRANDEVFKYVVNFLLNNYLQSNIMGMDEVFVNIADKYYLSGEANWVDSTSLVKIRDRVYKIKPNIIGKVARDLTMETSTGEWVSLHQVVSEYTVLYFWEPDCGHCKKATPKLKEIYNKYKEKGLEIFAVYTQDKKQEWIDYINKNELYWINAWDPDYKTYFRIFYDVFSTPTVYLLDKDKKIIAKRLSVDSLEKMIDSLL